MRFWRGLYPRFSRHLLCVASMWSGTCGPTATLCWGVAPFRKHYAATMHPLVMCDLDLPGDMQSQPVVLLGAALDRARDISWGRPWFCQHGAFSGVGAIVASFVSTGCPVGRGMWGRFGKPLKRAFWRCMGQGGDWPFPLTFWGGFCPFCSLWVEKLLLLPTLCRWGAMGLWQAP